MGYLEDHMKRMERVMTIFSEGLGEIARKYPETRQDAETVLMRADAALMAGTIPTQEPWS